MFDKASQSCFNIARELSNGETAQKVRKTEWSIQVEVRYPAWPRGQMQPTCWPFAEDPHSSSLRFRPTCAWTRSPMVRCNGNRRIERSYEIMKKLWCVSTTVSEKGPKGESYSCFGSRAPTEAAKLLDHYWSSYIITCALKLSSLNDPNHPAILSRELGSVALTISRESARSKWASGKEGIVMTCKGIIKMTVSRSDTAFCCSYSLCIGCWLSNSSIFYVTFVEK